MFVAAVRHIEILALIAVCIHTFNCAADTGIAPEQLFRDYVRDPSVLQWNNPGMSQSSQSSLTNMNAGVSRLTPTIQYDERAADAIANNVLRFAHNVGVQLSDNPNNRKSEIFSPLSIVSSLALLMLGAKGKSYQELHQLLGLDYDPEFRQNPRKFHEQFSYLLNDLYHHDEDRRGRLPNWRYTTAGNNIRGGAADRQKPYEHIILSANGLFTQASYSLNPDYKSVVKSIYFGELTSLDFRGNSAQARDHINAWISSKTRGKIPNVITDDIPESTKLIMATAIYFKALWENSFFEYATTVDNFYPDGSNQPPVKVKMMATGGTFPFYYSAENNCRIIGLPYMGNMTTMYVIQPNNSSRDKLRELQKLLSAEKIEQMISKMEQSSAVLAFPKMHFVRNINLRNLLTRLGVVEIFSSGLSDLSLIGGGNVYAPVAPAVASAPRLAMHYHRPQSAILDRFSEPAFIFPRFGDDDDHMAVAINHQTEPIGANVKVRREAVQPIYNRNSRTSTSGLDNLEAQRSFSNAVKSDFFVEDIVHAVDFDVNEQGTEAAAATLTYLRRSGTDVLFRADTPFLILIRHDPTKLVLFYGIINEPELE